MSQSITKLFTNNKFDRQEPTKATQIQAGIYRMWGLNMFEAANPHPNNGATTQNKKNKRKTSITKSNK